MEITGQLESSNHLLGDNDLLREHMAQQGYLYFEDVLEAAPIERLRDDILNILDQAQWLDHSYSTHEARTNTVPVVEGEPAYFAVYDKIQMLESLHGLAHEAALSDIMRSIVGESAFPHPLSIARLSFPNNDECTTPPHQDYPNNQGTEALYAAWIPLHDCPQQRGGIAILEGSQTLGLLPLEFSLGAGNRQARLPEQAQAMRWLSADFRLGDLLVFGSMTVHQALPNLSENQLRLSVDFRFQEEQQPLTPRVLEPHFARLSWDEIYANWQRPELKYYWKGKQYPLQEWDSSLHELPEGHMREAIQQSRAYNRRRDELRRQSERSSNHSKP